MVMNYVAGEIIFRVAASVVLNSEGHFLILLRRRDTLLRLTHMANYISLQGELMMMAVLPWPRRLLRRDPEASDLLATWFLSIADT